MTTEASVKSTSPDDIDLLLLAERVISFFSKYSWSFIIAGILGIVSGIFVYRSLPNIYTSRLILHSFVLTNQEHIQVIDNWNELLRKKEYEILASTLNCSGRTLSGLKKIKAEEIQKTFTGTNPHGFLVTVNVTNTGILDEIQKAVVFGLENNEYVKKRLDSKRTNLQLLIEETSAEIQKLDSIKKIMANIIAGKASSSSSIILDGNSINRQQIEINEKLLGFKEELKFTNAVQVLQGFSKFRKPSDPKLVPWIIIGLMVFLSLAFLYAVFMSIREKLKGRTTGMKGPGNQIAV
ncbi:MAG: hypothetical protein JNN00_01585 [Chitinophagaceae bacterium]|nr:hypothetical protein [Chitinophagaceae bacterium]